MPYCTVEIPDSVDPSRALQGLTRLAQTMAMGEVLVIPLPAGFPMGEVPTLGFRVREIVEGMVPAETGT